MPDGVYMTLHDMIEYDSFFRHQIQYSTENEPVYTHPPQENDTWTVVNDGPRGLNEINQ